MSKIPRQDVARPTTPAPSSIYLQDHDDTALPTDTGMDFEGVWESHDDDLKGRGATAHSHRPRGVSGPVRQYSITELVETLGSQDPLSSRQLPPELERRVLDFRLARQKRRQKHGEVKRWGMLGMYAHLSSMRIDLEWAEDAAWRRQNGAPYLSWSDFDDARKQTAKPWFTYSLVAACTVMLIVEFGLNGWKVAPLNENPLIGPSAEALIRAGARDTVRIVEDGQWFRIFTPLLLHAGIVHYVVNMAALWFIGAAIEGSHGLVNTIILFLVPGVGGNILSAIFLPQYISVGASGGIFGLIGGCVADIFLNWRILFIPTGEDDESNKRRNINAMIWLILEAFVNTVIGFTPYVDNFCHLGGFIYGLCCGLSTIEPLSVGFFGVGTTAWEKTRHIVVRFLGLIVSLLTIMFTTAWLARSDVGETPCNYCRYISCVPFPLFRQDKWWYCDDCDFVTAELYRIGQQYSRVDLTCPNGSIEIIDITDQNTDDREVVRKRLPAYCREFCDERFQ